MLCGSINKSPKDQSRTFDYHHEMQSLAVWNRYTMTVVLDEQTVDIEVTAPPFHNGNSVDIVHHFCRRNPENHHLRKRVYHNPDNTKRLYFAKEMKEHLMVVKRLEYGDKIVLPEWEEVDQYLRYNESGELPRFQKIPIFVSIIKAKRM